MAFSKAPLYPDIYRVPAFYARTFGHPERLAILHFLHEKGQQNALELVRHSMLSQPVVSQHLGILRNAGLVAYEENYPFIRYSLAEKDLERAFRSLIRVANRLSIF